MWPKNSGYYELIQNMNVLFPIDRLYGLFVDSLMEAGYLKSIGIIKAFRKINRVDFVLPGDEDEALINAPLPIGQGQTISQPATVAIMLELLQPEKGDKILDVGSGSGWTTALLAELVGPHGQVCGLELLPDICDFGSSNLAKYNFKNAKNICGDGYKGLREFAPYDKILVSAASPSVPKNLLRQLKIGGRMVIPIGAEYANQELLVIDKTGENEYEESAHPGFIFVPLIKK